MARYSLRRQKKIVSRYGDRFLKRIISSLDEAFKSNSFEIRNVENEPYPILDINDNGRSCGLIMFYVIGQTYDVYNLAFKEIVN